MKKKPFALFILFVSILFALSGCQSEGRGKAENMIVTDFSADFSAEYRETEIKGTITSTRQGVMDIKITSPDALSGLEVTYKNSEMLISLDSLECSADEAYLPESAFVQVMRSVMRGIADGRQTLSAENDGGKIYSLKASDSTAVLYVDGEGFITEIELKDSDFKMSFENVTQL